MAGRRPVLISTMTSVNTELHVRRDVLSSHFNCRCSIVLDNCINISGTARPVSTMFSTLVTGFGSAHSPRLLR